MSGGVIGIPAWNGRLPNSKEAKECGAAGYLKHDILELGRRPGQDQVDQLHDFYSDQEVDLLCTCGGLFFLNPPKDFVLKALWYASCWL